MFTTAYTPSPHLKTRRQSQIPLLGLSMPIGGEANSASRRFRNRWSKLLLGSVVVVWGLCYFGSGGQGSTVTLLKGVVFGEASNCEAEGKFSSWRSEDEQRRLTIRIQPQLDQQEKENPDNTILSQPFYPILSSQIPSFFENSSDYLPPPLRSPAETCVTPITHSLPLLAKTPVTSSSPTIFFSICTAPERAIEFSPVWKHFMSAPEHTKGEVEASLPAPGCVITDAQGTGDSKGMAKANAEFRRQGISCTMQESSRVGQRYEMRVLGLIRDAWVESERRRWQEGAQLVEWFVFGDDDTWWSDVGMLKEMLAAFDSREDHFMGSFSEARGTVEHFGRISFGGGGTIISRGLVRKMQTTLDRCAERFQDVFGGDGLISRCAAWTRDIDLNNIVEEIPSMRQMDLRGDSTGYLTSGRTPFMSLHHWASWLSLIPDRSGITSIALFSQAASMLGGPNFLRRFIFDSGAVEITLGYAVTLYRDPLKEEDLGAAEHTWEAHDPYLPARRKLEEGSEKLTYYISSIECISPNLAIFHHTCSHPSVSSSSLKTFSILYDTRTAETTWSSRFFGGNAGRAQASPRSNLSDKQRQRTRRIAFHS